MSETSSRPASIPRKQASLVELQRLITEGLDSGISNRPLPDVLDAARHHVKARRENSAD